MIFPVVVAVAVLVTLGYLALWTSAHERTSKQMAGFGKIMAMIVFVLAGLMFIVGITFSAKCGMCPMCHFMGKMHGGAMMGQMMGEGPCGEKGAPMNVCNADTIKCQMMEWQKKYPDEMKQCMKEMRESKKMQAKAAATPAPEATENK